MNVVHAVHYTTVYWIGLDWIVYFAESGALTSIDESCAVHTDFYTYGAHLWEIIILFQGGGEIHLRVLISRRSFPLLFVIDVIGFVGQRVKELKNILQPHAT